MKMPRPSEADKERFRSLVPDEPRFEVKPMFGNLDAFVNGNMFAGLFGQTIGVRLGDADRDDLLAEDGSGPFGPEERPMGGYVSLPDAWEDEPAKASVWIARAIAYVEDLPPKAARPRKAKR